MLPKHAFKTHNESLEWNSLPGTLIFIGELFTTMFSPNICRNSRLEVFLQKGALKIVSKFTREHLCQSVISIKLQCNFIEIALQHGCSTVNLLHILRTPFYKITSGRLLLYLLIISCNVSNRFNNLKTRCYVWYFPFIHISLSGTCKFHLQ